MWLTELQLNTTDIESLNSECDERVNVYADGFNL